MPGCIDHTYVGAACTGRDGAVLMRDVGPWLVPAGDAPVDEADHVAFVDHLAALHAAFWDWTDDVGLAPLANRFFMFSPWMVAVRGGARVPRAGARRGARRLGAARGPRAACVGDPGAAAPRPVAARRPRSRPPRRRSCTATRRWGTSAADPDGRTILIDWALPGRSVGCLELADYLALNRARIPRGFAPEATIAEYRGSLERHGVETGPWWETQLALALLGIMVLLGWEKALGPPDDLVWWEARVLEGAELLPNS